MSVTLLDSISKYGGIVDKVYTLGNLVYKQFFQNEKRCQRVL
jgi:hypothetical protein